MMKICQTRSFGTVVRWRLFFCLLLISVKGFSQKMTVSGIVFDKENRDRIASVNIRNITANTADYNNLKGEFKIIAKVGDMIVFSRQDFHPDTIRIKDTAQLAIYMGHLAIQLHEVAVHDSLRTPQQRYDATRRDYNKIYGSLAYDDFLSVPSIGSAGLSIDALWNSLSRSGRNAEKLRGIIENDYHQNIIDYRFNKTFVGKVTGLTGDKLTDFMTKYRPGYYTTITMSDYEFISLIRNNYRRYLRRPRTYTLPPLLSK
jgi:hypothetical protein